MRWTETLGVTAKRIYQYLLERCEGQGELLSNRVEFAASGLRKNMKERIAERARSSKVLCKDVTHGAEMQAVRGSVLGLPQSQHRKIKRHVLKTKLCIQRMTGRRHGHSDHCN